MKKVILFSLLALSLLELPGCLDKKDRMQTTAPSISHSPTLTKGDLDGKLAEIVEDVGKRMDTSENAIQQNMQSVLGVSVGKVADDLVKLQAQFKNLAEFNTTLSTKFENNMSASLTSNNELRVMLKTQMEFNATMVNAIKVTADMEAKINAFGAAQAGLNNKIDQQTQELKQTLSAGRDVNNTTTQFNQQMLDALKSANKTTSDTSQQYAWILLAIVLVSGIIIIVYMHVQKTKAENRAATADRELKEHRVKLERALSIMTTSPNPIIEQPIK